MDSSISSYDIQRPTVARINLSNLTHNIDQIKKHTKDCNIMAIVKANAYGHGIISIAHHLVNLGIGQLGVAFLEEAIELRKSGICKPLLVLGGIHSSQIEYFLDYDIELTISSLDKLRQVEKVAESRKKKAIIHLKIDTGMERVGVHSYSSESFIEAALKSQQCELKGFYSHLACADDPNSPMTLQQIERFEEAISYFKKIGAPRPICHLANSGGIIHYPESYYDMIRPGIMIYGVYPDPTTKRLLDLKPALSLSSKIVFFKVVQPGSPVSYGATWQSDHLTRIVTIPIGYGDGFPRSLSNRGEVLINGNRYPIVGRVCMDQFMVNIEWNSAYNDDEVVLIGSQENEKISVEDVAQWANTIPYEILTGLNNRIPRIYQE